MLGEPQEGFGSSFHGPRFVAEGPDVEDLGGAEFEETLVTGLQQARLSGQGDGSSHDLS